MATCGKERRRDHLPASCAGLESSLPLWRHTAHKSRRTRCPALQLVSSMLPAPGAARKGAWRRDNRRVRPFPPGLCSTTQDIVATHSDEHGKHDAGKADACGRPGHSANPAIGPGLAKHSAGCDERRANAVSILSACLCACLQLLARVVMTEQTATARSSTSHERGACCGSSSAQ